MNITCGSCSTPLAIPDENLPKGVPAVSVACPKCSQQIVINLMAASTPAPAAASAPAAPAPAPAPAPAASAPPAPEPPPPAPAPPEPEPEPEPEEPVDLDDGFVEGKKLAMACFDQAEQQAQVKTALEAGGYTVHAPAKASEALHRLAHHKYEVLLIHEEYGGSADKNQLLKSIQIMAMTQRRQICAGLVGKSYRTMDNMAAFAKSVNFVVAERELEKIQAITQHAVADNDLFYRAFRETLQEVGKV